MSSIAAGMPATVDHSELTLPENNKTMGVFTKICIALIFLCEFIVLMDKSYQTITGPIFLVTMMFLQFTDYFFVPLTVIMVPLGTLGTVFAGRIAVYALLFPLLILRLLVKGGSLSLRASDLGLLLIGALHVGQLILCENYLAYTDKLVYVSAAIVWLVYINGVSRDDRTILNRFALSLAVCVTVDALASVLSRQYTLYENSDRMGLAGISGGHPNHAAFYIGLSIAIFLATKNLKVWIKLLFMLVLGFALITTVSISGIIGVTVVILAFFLFTNKNKQKLRIFLAILLAAILVLSIFPMLNIQSTSTSYSSNYLEYYQDKLNDRLESFLNKDYDDATSDRTGLTRENLEYLSKQPVYRQLFGGNSANPRNDLPSHNSFADILLRFGYLGLIVVILMVAYRFYKEYVYARQTGDCVVLMFKIAMLFWSFSTSMFEGMSSTIWFAFLLMY